MAFGRKKKKTSSLPPEMRKLELLEKKAESSKRSRGDKLILNRSCAGCQYHDMGLLPDSQPSLFNHYCKFPNAWALFSLPEDKPARPELPILTYAASPRLFPPPPLWCRENRPVSEY